MVKPFIYVQNEQLTEEKERTREKLHALQDENRQLQARTEALDKYAV